MALDGHPDVPGRHRRRRGQGTTLTVVVVLVAVALVGTVLLVLAVLDTSSGPGASPAVPAASPGARSGSTTDGAGSPGTGFSGSGDVGRPVVEVTLGAATVGPMQAVPVSGRATAAAPGTRVQVQHKTPGGGWETFPLQPVVGGSGEFVTHVELGTEGRNVLRVVEPDSGAVSDRFVVVVR